MDDGRRQWDQDGYAVLRGAAPAEALTAYPEDLAREREGLLVRAPGDEHASLAIRAEPGTAGVLDPYARSEAARQLLLPESVVAFLADVLGDPPLLFDAAESAAGAPDVGPYRDATYVALADDPATLVGAVVALGPATIAVIPGSQHLTTSPFSGRYRHFNPERDGDAALARHRDELSAALAAHDRERETVALDAGDVLLWQADLVHEAADGEALYAHLCPARVRPSWFAYRPERARHAAFDGAWIASQHYDLGEAVAPADAPEAAPPSEPELERVEQALEAHDDRPPDAPSPPPPSTGAQRRGGGLMNSVRSLMGRRGRQR